MSLRASDNERTAATATVFSAVRRAPTVGRLRRRVGMVLYYAVLIAAAAAFMIPVGWLVLSSLKLNAEFRAYPITILPRTPIWGNYYDNPDFTAFRVSSG